MAVFGTLSSPTVKGQITESYGSGSLNLSVPDDYPDHLESASSTIDITSSQSQIVNIDVELTIDGGYNGDMYVTLSHGTGFSVLLNRVGRSENTGVASYGYMDAGLNQVRFSDGAASGDVHLYRLTLSGSDNVPLSGPLTGVWAPDGRTTQPDAVLTSDNRSAPLSSFSGLNPNGEWTLSLTDWAGPDVTTSTLSNWKLDITAVPEASAYPLVTGFLLAGFGVACRSGRARNRQRA